MKWNKEKVMERGLWHIIKFIMMFIVFNVTLIPQDNHRLFKERNVM